ncbi:MAG: SAM-dependent methyltransferase [Planctomycetota bacterium]|jgi:SAM-dependent methyltransferase
MTLSIDPDLFADLVQMGAASWSEFIGERSDFQALIPADPILARERLSELKPSSHTFLELGCGVGVITILADLLGYEAYGIEIEPLLLDRAESLSLHCGSKATFCEGSFVPTEYRDEIGLMSLDFPTKTEGDDAYAELGMKISDFDLVYVYPHPDEEEWMHELVHRFRGPTTQLMTYSVQDGFLVSAA